MKRKVSMLLIIVLVVLQFSQGFSLMEAKAEGTQNTEKQVLYSDESGKVITQIPSMEIMEDTADLSTGKYLKLSVSLDGEEQGTQIFRYEENPGETTVEENEGYGVETLTLDGETLESGSALSFAEDQENQLLSLEVSLYTKAKLTVHYQDEEGNVLAEDEHVEGKLNDPVQLNLKDINGYEQQGNQDNLIFSEKEQETILVYKKKAEENSKDNTSQNAQPVTESEATQTEADETTFTITMEDAKGINIDGGMVKFHIESTPIVNGKIVMKLPAFFSLTADPTSSEKYTVEITDEAIASDDMLNGVTQKVITIRLKNVTSTVKVSFEMSLTDKKGLTNAMILAGEHPDQVPLNLEGTLYDASDKVLNSEKKTGTSALSQANEISYGNLEQILTYNANFINKGYNVLAPYWFSSPSATVGSYHYPYSNVKMLIPACQDTTLKNIKLSNYEEFVTAEKVTYSGKPYVVLNRLDAYADNNYAEKFYPNITISELIFSDDVKIGTNVTFDGPIVLQYIYKGKIEYKELYFLPEYTWQGPLKPYEKEEKKEGWIGEETTLSGTITNNPFISSGKDSIKELPIDWENLTMELSYPYELQPKQIKSLQGRKSYEISYLIANKADETKRTVKDTVISYPYNFKINENEYVKKVSIAIPELQKKAGFDYSISAEVQKEYANGSATAGGEKVNYQIRVLDQGAEQISLTTQTFQFKMLVDALRARTDTAEEGNMYKIFLDGSEDTIELPTLSLGASTKDCKSYEDSTLTLKAPPEITSKIVGYKITSKVAKFPDVTIRYQTNEGEKTISSGKLELGKPAMCEFDLAEGEYITGVGIELGDLTKEELYQYYADACQFTPIINLKRNYYNVEGAEAEPTYGEIYQVSYEFSTSSLPAVNMTEDKMKGLVSYCSYLDFQMVGGGSGTSMYSITKEGTEVSSAYRGDLLTAPIQGISSLLSPEVRNAAALDPSLYGTTCKIYIEIDPDFEITSLSLSNQLLEEKVLENGNVLYAFKAPCKDTIAVKSLAATLYVRPDANVDNTHEPIKGLAVCYDDYFTEKYPDYPDCDKEMSTSPFQIVTMSSNTSYKKFPTEWGISEREKTFGFYHSYQYGFFKNLQVREFTTSTTVLCGTLDSLLSGKQVSFYEVQREKIGAKAYISPTSAATINAYKATFLVPQQGDTITGEENKTYTADYSLYLSNQLKIYKNRQPVDLNAEGITIQYVLENGATVGSEALTEDNYGSVRKIEILFSKLSPEITYELRIPLYADSRSGTNINDWKSYLGSYNQTGDGELVYNAPVEYLYKSYRIESIFGLDKYETGDYNPVQTSYALPITSKLIVYDEAWNELFSEEAPPNWTSSIQRNFNTNGKTLKYVGFELDAGERDSYLPTLKGTISDLPAGDTNIHEFADGRKVWYLPIDEADFITNTTAGKYDALFIRKPEVTASDITLDVNEEGKLDFSVSQPVNADKVKAYTISVQLLEGESTDIAQIIQKEDGFYAKGLKKGKVSYNVTVTNTQGIQVSATAQITVSDGGVGNLTVAKTVTGKLGNKQKDFNFTVTLVDKTISETYGDMTFVDGVATFTLKHGEEKTASGIPDGMAYEVTEEKDDNYITTASNDQGTIVKDATVTAEFTNEKKDTPLTGIWDDIAPWKAAFGILLLLLLGGFGLSLFRKRRGRG